MLGWSQSVKQQQQSTDISHDSQQHNMKERQKKLVYIILTEERIRNKLIQSTHLSFDIAISGERRLCWCGLFDSCCFRVEGSDTLSRVGWLGLL